MSQSKSRFFNYGIKSIVPRVLAIIMVTIPLLLYQNCSSGFENNGSLNPNDNCSLPQNTFVSMPQDSSCFNKLASNKINVSLVTSNGNMLVGTDSGLSISYDQGSSFVTKTTNHGLNHNSVHSLFEASNGDIFIGTGNGLNFISHATGQIEDYVTNFGSQSIVEIAAGSSGRLFIATQSSGVRINSLEDPNDFAFKGTNVGLPSNWIKHIHVSSTDRLFVGTSFGLFYADGPDYDTFTAVTNFNNSIDKNVYGVFSRKVNNTTEHIYVHSGLELYMSTDNGQNFTLIKAVSNEFFVNNSVMIQPDGSLVAATTKNIYLSSNNFSLDAVISLPHPAIDYPNVAIYAENQFLIGSEYGLYHLNFSNFNITRLDNNEILDEIGAAIDMYIDNSGVLYVLHYYGLAISFDKGQTFIYKTDFNLKTSGHFVSIDGFENNLYLASSNSGYYLSTNDGQSFTNIREAQGLPDDETTHLSTDKNGWLYFTRGSSISISKDQGQSFETFDTSNGLPALNIYKALIHNDKIYVATSDGVYISEDNGQNFSQKTVAPANSQLFSELYVTDSGRILVSQFGTHKIYYSDDNGDNFSAFTYDTDKHLLARELIIDGSNYIAVGFDGILVSNNGGLTFDRYTAESGAGQDVFYFVAVDKDKSIYAGMEDGLAVSRSAFSK